MKTRLLAIIAAALAVSSCSKSETVDVSSGRQIDLNAYTSGVSSRASSINNVDDLKTDGFRLHAYIGPNRNWGELQSFPVTEKYFDNKVTYTDGNWSIVNGPYYWPTDSYVQFFAYAPENAPGVTWYEPASDPYQWPNFSYSIPNVEDQRDLMGANTFNKNKDSGPVNLAFNHLLTQINFKCAGAQAGYKYTVTAIKLVGAYTTAHFIYNGYEEGGASAAAMKTPVTRAEEIKPYPGVFGEWHVNTHDGSSNYTYDISGTTNWAEDKTQINLATSSNAFMLIPQTTPEGTQIIVTYSVSTKTGQVLFSNKEKIAVLDGKEWVQGTKVTYLLTLPMDATAIEVEGTVTPWGDASPVDPEPWFASGDGTEANPWVIQNVTQLSNMRKPLSGLVTGVNRFYFELGADIELNGTTWSAVKVNTDLKIDFKLDGKNHKIFNLYRSISVDDYFYEDIGLFSDVNNVEITNLNIENFQINTSMAGMYWGLLTGSAYGSVKLTNSTISNCTMNNTAATSSSTIIANCQGDIVFDNVTLRNNNFTATLTVCIVCMHNKVSIKNSTFNGNRFIITGDYVYGKNAFPGIGGTGSIDKFTAINTNLSGNYYGVADPYVKYVNWNKLPGVNYYPFYTDYDMTISSYGPE